LRGQGLSYNKKKKRAPVTKSALSLWCRNVILTPGQLEKLKQRRLKGAERGRFIGAKRQQQNRIERTKKLLQEGKKEVGKLNKRDKFIAGIGLYLGDGLKGDKSIGFSNSNPTIIKFMISWFREFCRIPEEKFRGQIWIHSNQDEHEARKYWSKIINIPLSQIQKSYIAKNKKQKNKKKSKSTWNSCHKDLERKSPKENFRLDGWDLRKQYCIITSNINNPR